MSEQPRTALQQGLKGKSPEYVIGFLNGILQEMYKQDNGIDWAMKAYIKMLSEAVTYWENNHDRQ